MSIRGALPADATDIARLMAQLGYPMSPPQAAARLEQLATDRAGTLLVATDWDGTVIGLIALHWCAMLQQPNPIGRITTLVVDDQQQRRGIGRQLVKAGAQAARVAGCDILELTTGEQRTAAHAFYRSIGFTQTSLRFWRSLRKRVPQGTASRQPG